MAGTRATENAVHNNTTMLSFGEYMISLFFFFFFVKLKSVERETSVNNSTKIERGAVAVFH